MCILVYRHLKTMVDKWLTVAVFAALISVATCGLFSRSADEGEFTVLVDAGSSSSKVKVYSYSWNLFDNTSTLPEVNLVNSQKFKPSLSSFQDDIESVEGYLRDIVDNAKSFVPEDQQAETDIMLMATSGFRFMSAEKSQALMGKVQELLSDDAFSPFKYSKKDIQVLSGEEEATYAWIAANYLNDVFREPPGKSVGVMEMGGGSTQIAFLPDGPLYAEEFQVTMASRLYQVYTQSYLNMGADGIQRKIVQFLQNFKDNIPLPNPCLLQGDRKNITLEDGRVVDTVGLGTPVPCMRILRKILEPATGPECQPKPCAVGSVYQPALPNMTFYATQAFEYAPNAVGAVREDGTLDLQKLIMKGRKYCRKTVDEVVAEGGSAKYASNNCVNSLYIPILFNMSYGFPSDTQNIVLTSEINGQNIDWALGATLLEISRTKTMHTDDNVVRRK